MAKSRRTPVSEERVRHLYFNKFGEKEFEVGHMAREYATDGGESVETIQEHWETASGRTVAAPPPGSRGAKQEELRTCDVCYEERHRSGPSRTGHKLTMSPADTMKACSDCRRALCSDHSITSRFDSQVRCRHCHRRHLLYKWVVEPILFVRQDTP
jgi:hypothetical protein